MIILSLFDGISCGQLALKRAGIVVDEYYASEIDKSAIKVTQDNFPNTKQLGDVLSLDVENLPKIDMLIGGSPCQSFSRAGNQQEFADDRGKLFFAYYKVLQKLKSKNPDLIFLLENVVMSSKSEAIINGHMGVKPITIDSALLSAQRRKRLYWTNIQGITQPTDKKLFIKDIMETNCPKYEFVHPNFTASAVRKKNYLQYDLTNKGHNSQNYRAYYPEGKMCTLSHTTPHGAKILVSPTSIRKTTRFEHERLQTLPDNYTKAVSLNQAKCAIGNGWTVDIISHILKKAI